MSTLVEGKSKKLAYDVGFNSKIHNCGIVLTGLRSVELLGEINQYGRCLIACKWHTHIWDSWWIEVCVGLKF